MSNIVPATTSPAALSDDQAIETYRMKISCFNLLMKILSKLPGTSIWIENSILLHRHQNLFFRCNLVRIEPYNKKLNFCCRMEKKQINELKKIKLIDIDGVIIKEYNYSYQIVVDNIYYKFEKEFSRPDKDLAEKNEIIDYTKLREMNNASNFKNFVDKKKFVEIYIDNKEIQKIKDDSNGQICFSASDNYQHILRIFYFLKVTYFHISLQVKQLKSQNNYNDEILDDLLKSIYLVTIYNIHPEIHINQAEQAIIVHEQENNSE